MCIRDSFVHHPDFKKYAGESRNTVTQNIDLMPTFLSMNDKNIPKEVKGRSILEFLERDIGNHTALYGYWGGGINITDGHYTYFHYPENYDQTSLNKYQYTLMPTHRRGFFSEEELRTAKMHKPFSFTKDIPVMQIKSDKNLKRYVDTKSALYDLIKDPGQLNSIKDNHLIDKYKELMIKVIKENDPPKELLFNYFGI